MLKFWAKYQNGSMFTKILVRSVIGYVSSFLTFLLVASIVKLPDPDPTLQFSLGQNIIGFLALACLPIIGGVAMMRLAVASHPLLQRIVNTLDYFFTHGGVFPILALWIGFFIIGYHNPALPISQWGWVEFISAVYYILASLLMIEAMTHTNVVFLEEHPNSLVSESFRLWSSTICNVLFMFFIMLQVSTLMLFLFMAINR